MLRAAEPPDVPDLQSQHYARDQPPWKGTEPLELCRGLKHLCHPLFQSRDRLLDRVQLRQPQTARIGRLGGNCRIQHSKCSRTPEPKISLIPRTGPAGRTYPAPSESGSSTGCGRS